MELFNTNTISPLDLSKWAAQNGWILIADYLYGENRSSCQSYVTPIGNLIEVRSEEKDGTYYIYRISKIKRTMDF